jgi:site-specific DNA-methyltransferase (adenine-specific)
LNLPETPADRSGALGAEKGQKEGKNGSDKGIDGIMVFTDDNSGKAKRVIVSVKSGHVNVSHIRDLGHVINRENAAIGVFVTLEKPSRDMTTEAVGKGFYHSDGWHRDYPRLQILTIEELLSGKQVDIPPSSVTFKQAEKCRRIRSISIRLILTSLAASQKLNREWPDSCLATRLMLNSS